VNYPKHVISTEGGNPFNITFTRKFARPKTDFPIKQFLIAASGDFPAYGREMTRS
jgi:hypothetical protein